MTKKTKKKKAKKETKSVCNVVSNIKKDLAKAIKERDEFIYKMEKHL